MARPQNQKRQRANEPLQSNPPAKKAKLGESNFSPGFWDNLSKVWLTPRALRELDRRNQSRPWPRFAVPKLCRKNLGRFARHGGPDLCHLRGYTKHNSVAEKISPSRSSTSQSQQTQSTNATSVTRTKSSSAYGKEFQQHLTDSNIHMNNRRSKPANYNEIRSELANDRASLSPSQFSENAFKEFVRNDEDATFKNDITRTIIPIISGNYTIHKQNVQFTKLKPITNQNAVKPQPDFFDGACLQDLRQEVRNNQAILSTGIPTKHPSVPVEPNFFLEVKGPEGNASVAQRQACYHGAYGARAMHALQNYQDSKLTYNGKLTYDGNAYTYSSTYHAGALKMYAHHVTAPATAEGSPGYHMTQLRTFAMTDTRETFIKGATAFRNARDLAERHRNSFIQTANARAAQKTAVMQQELVETNEEGPVPLESQESDTYTALQDADYALQQQIADSSEDALAHGAEEHTTAPQCLYTEEDSPNASQESAVLAPNEPSMSFASSLTTLTTDSLQPKRPRDSFSPPSTSKRTHISQGRTGSGTARPTARSSS